MQVLGLNIHLIALNPLDDEDTNSLKSEYLSP